MFETVLWPTGARSRSGSSAPCARSACARWPSSPTPTRTPGTSARPTRRYGSVRRRPPRATCRWSGCWRRRRGRRAGRAPGLRLPRGERGLRARVRRRRARLHRSSGDAIALMGDKIRAKETVRRPGSRSCPAPDPELAEAPRVGMPVLLKPSAGGGGKGMRWSATLPPGRRDRRRPPRGPRLLRRRHPPGRALGRPPPPHRDPGPGRRPRQRRPPRRARVLPAAPAPEGHRGGARACSSTPAPARDGRGGGPGGPLVRVRRARARSSSSCRATTPRRTTSWR
jgi:hypothetical protein